MIEPVAGEEVVEEFGPHHLAARQHLFDIRGAAALAQPMRHRIVVLIPVVVALEIGGIHVVVDRVLEARVGSVPDIGRTEIGPHQPHQIVENRAAQIDLAIDPLQPCDDLTEQMEIFRRHVPHGSHAAPRSIPRQRYADNLSRSKKNNHAQLRGKWAWKWGFGAAAPTA